MTYCIDKIFLPHLCTLCFITFLAIYQGKFGFGKFQHKLGLRSDRSPPPLLGQMPKLFRKSNLTAPLTNSVLPGHVKVPAAVEGTPGAEDEEIYAWEHVAQK